MGIFQKRTAIYYNLQVCLWVYVLDGPQGTGLIKAGQDTLTRYIDSSCTSRLLVVWCHRTQSRLS